MKYDGRSKFHWGQKWFVCIPVYVQPVIEITNLAIIDKIQKITTFVKIESKGYGNSNNRYPFKRSKKNA